MTEPNRTRAHDLALALRTYVAGAEEAARLQAYQVARDAMGGGVGLLDIAAEYREALAMVSTGPPEESSPWVEAYTELLEESLGPFEMAHRGIREAHEALLRANRDLEQQILERQGAEEAASLAREEADSANRAKSDFLSRMSHELRTPLNAVLGFAQLLEVDEITPLQAESVGQILRSGRHLLDLINEMLDIARIESGRLSLSLEPLAVTDVVREAATLIGPIASDRNVAVILDPSIEEASPVTGDRQRLLQVLINLLSNAVKYNRNGGSAVISARSADGYVSIDVADTGRGIPIDQLSRLFLPFDRLGVEATGIEGVGLGLSLSKALVEAMSGIVEVESRPGEGATFRVKLPVAAAQPDRLERHSPATHDEENLATAGCVLYIEDNASNLKLVARLLERRPRVRLLTALLGGLGLELAREHEPDLILLDGHLPDMDGAMVLHRLRADSRTAKIPVVILSADATAGQVERLLAAGAADYMTKPLDVPRVLQVIDAFLRGDQRSEIGA